MKLLQRCNTVTMYKEFDVTYTKTYIAKYINRNTGGYVFEERPFNQFQATQAGVVLHPLGLRTACAEAIIRDWNRTARLFHGEDRFELNLADVAQ